MSKFESAVITGVYAPNINRIKLPLIPGRSIAHIAIAPEIVKNKGELDCTAGGRDVIVTAINTPNKIIKYLRTVLGFTSLERIGAEARTSPKKKARNSVGYSICSQCIEPDKAITALINPIPKTAKKLKLYLNQTTLSPSL